MPPRVSLSIDPEANPCRYPEIVSSCQVFLLRKSPTARHQVPQQYCAKPVTMPPFPIKAKVCRATKTTLSMPGFVPIVRVKIIPVPRRIVPFANNPNKKRHPWPHRDVGVDVKFAMSHRQLQRQHRRGRKVPVGPGLRLRLRNDKQQPPPPKPQIRPARHPPLFPSIPLTP